MPHTFRSGIGAVCCYAGIIQNIVTKHSSNRVVKVNHAKVEPGEEAVLDVEVACAGRIGIAHRVWRSPCVAGPLWVFAMHSIRVVKVIRSTVIPIKPSVEVALIDSPAIYVVSDISRRTGCAKSAIMRQDWFAEVRGVDVDCKSGAGAFIEPDPGNVDGLRGRFCNINQRCASSIIGNGSRSVHFKYPHRYRPAAAGTCDLENQRRSIP